jgi:hypothetical protein
LTSGFLLASMRDGDCPGRRFSSAAAAEYFDDSWTTGVDRFLEICLSCLLNARKKFILRQEEMRFAQSVVLFFDVWIPSFF